MIASLRRGIVAMLLPSALAACEREHSPVAVGLPDVSDVRPYVTASLASKLDARGQFVLPPAPDMPDPQVNGEQARQLGLSTLRTFGSFNKTYFEQTHGAPIDLDHLTPAPRAYYAISPWEPRSNKDPLSVRKAWGPFYLVTFLDPDGAPVLSGAIPAYSTDVGIDGNGRIRHGGNMTGFFLTGIDKDWGVSIPLSPEQAVAVASSATGARVAEVPQLVLPGLMYKPQWARWRLKLDRTVPLRSKDTGVQHHTAELYVGLRGEISVPGASQPGAVDVPGLGSGAPGLRLVRRVGIPVEFESVVPASR